MWTHRIMLEAGLYQANSFLTLTYRDEKLPRSGSGLMTLAPEDLRNFWKRLRKSLATQRASLLAAKVEVPTHADKLRYYAVGEYGDVSQRPHYHAAIFNFGSCLNGHSTLSYKGRPMFERCCSQCRLVGEVWGQGDIVLGKLDAHSAQYVAGYVLKKMTRFDDPRLGDRHPEFSRSSNRKGGIGRDAMFEVASVLMALGLEESEADVPSALRHGKRLMPLGRYLKQQLRLMVGKEVNVPQEVVSEIEKTLLPLRVAARSDNENPSFKRKVIEHFAQEVLNRETRSKVFKRKASL